MLFDLLLVAVGVLLGYAGRWIHEGYKEHARELRLQEYKRKKAVKAAQRRDAKAAKLNGAGNSMQSGEQQWPAN